jgi:hypothetical protein
MRLVVPAGALIDGSEIGLDLGDATLHLIAYLDIPVVAKVLTAHPHPG